MTTGLRWGSVRGRLWTVLAALALATVVVGTVALVALQRAEARLDRLHRDTLAEVAHALALSRDAADLATSAPYLLNLPSVIRVRQEASAITRAIATMRAEATGVPGFDAPLAAMDIAVSDLVHATERMTTVREQGLRLVAELSATERQVALAVADPLATLPVRRGWLLLQRLASAAIGVGRADSLIAAGEFQRDFAQQAPILRDAVLTAAQQDALRRIETIVAGADGLFEARRHELASRLLGQNALFRIRRAADVLSEVSAGVVADAQQKLSFERNATTSSIAVARLAVATTALASIAIALAAAFYVANYVTANLAAISGAMMRLASGDRSSRLPRGEGAGDEIGKLFYAFRVFRANTLRLDRSHRQLAQKNALFERVFGNISDGVAIFGEDGRLVVANPPLPRILRITPSLLADRPTLQDLRAASPFGGGDHGDWSSPEGFVLEARHNSLPDGGAVWMFADATEKRRIDERLAQIQRIESLGKVTGEAAHDFGNILTTIAGCLQLWDSRPEQDSGQLRRRISDAVDLGVALTQRLLAFARKQHLEPETVELNALVEGVTDLVSFAMRDEVALRVVPSPDALQARIDPGQLESALLNLCLNANQALEGPGEVVITLRRSGEQLAEISVSDNGPGMAPDVLRHAMEPFYSARSDGTGTGLGLSMVYGFIGQSGGDMRIASEPGLGTTVTLCLPLAGQQTPARPADALRCLAVDDDPAALRAIASVLAELGCQVTASGSYEHAEKILQGNDLPDVLFTDLELGAGKSGWALAETFLRRAPEGRVVVVSGHLPHTHPLLRRYPARIDLIDKPATAAALAPLLNARQHEPETTA